MNKIIVLSILILGFLIISGCGKQAVDCGTDQTCFYKNFRSCTPAKIGGGLMEVKGGSVESCDIHAEGDNPTILQNGEIKHERVTMECIVPNTSTFKDIEINILGFISKGSCSGSLYDLMNNALQTAKDIQNKQNK